MAVDRRVAGVVVLVAATALVASFGFSSLTANPLAPELAANVSDATDEYPGEGSGPTDVLTIVHEGGEAVDLANVSVVLGTRGDGLTFRPDTGFTVETATLEFVLLLNGDRIGPGDTFAEGDRLTVRKTSGTPTFDRPVDIRVRLFHLVSQKAVVDETVRVT